MILDDGDIVTGGFCFLEGKSESPISNLCLDKSNIDSGVYP
jgi:hypothetical protein